MAKFFESKTASEVKVYNFSPDIAKDDGIASFVATPTGVTIDASEENGDTIYLTISGGTAAATGSVLVTTTTDNGETLIETIYVPVIDSPAQVADTARSYINFALRKITGIGETPDADELDDALEQLNGLIAMWREGGADIGAPYPLTANSVIYCPDWAVNALRYNLREACMSLYGAEIDPRDLKMAKQGLQLVKHKNLPDERRVDYY